MSEIVIRHADMHDLEQLSRLYAEFHEFHVRGVPDRLVRSGTSRITELRPVLEKIITDKDATIIIAEVDGHIVGFGEVYVREDVPHALRVKYTYGHLQSMVVTGAHRGKGIGTRILEAVEQWAKEKNAAEIRLDTWEFKEGPFGFYEKRGYSTLRRTLVRRLYGCE